MPSSPLFVSCILLLFLCAFSGDGGSLVRAFEENDKFCIRTEPLLLADIEKHVNPTADDPNCEIFATTMTNKEEESFANTMCKDYGSSRMDDFHFFKLRNGELNGRASYKEICEAKKKPLLAWVPYEMILQNFMLELNPKEHINYIAKATDIEREKTELCHFRHYDLVNNLTSNLFTCIVMIFEDNFYGLDANINVLVEIQPIMYEIHNVTYMPWMNVTTTYKTLLGKTVLQNPRREKKQIFGSIKYTYVEKVDLNMSSIYRNDQLERLPLLFEHMGSVLELNNAGVGGVNVQTSAYFGRIMDPKNTVNVEVIGQWAEHTQQFNADVYEYFGYGIKRFHNELHQGMVTFTRIESTEPVFEWLDSSHTADIRLHTPGGKKFERLEEAVDEYALERRNSKHHLEWEGEDYLDSPHNGHPYPGFYPWFIAGTIVVAVVLLTVVIGMVRTWSKREERRRYKLAATVQPHC